MCARNLSSLQGRVRGTHTHVLPRTCRIISIVSEMWLSVFSQYAMSFSNTMKYLEAFMVDSVTMFSSRLVKISSVLRSLKVDLYSAMSRPRADHVAAMALMLFSMANSCGWCCNMHQRGAQAEGQGMQATGRPGVAPSPQYRNMYPFLSPHPSTRGMHCFLLPAPWWR